MGYKNVSTLLELMDRYDQQKLLDLFEEADLHELVDDVAYVMVTIFAGMNRHELKRIKDQVLDESARIDFQELDFDDED